MNNTYFDDLINSKYIFDRNYNNNSIDMESSYLQDVIDDEFEFISLDNTNDIIQDKNLSYPSLPDFDYWINFLNRPLKYDENQILYDYFFENDMNLQIKSLHYNLISNGAFTIGKLTKNNGNCLFESLSYLGYGDSLDIRKNIGALLLSVKNDCNFFPHKKICPEELFINHNDIGLVKEKYTGKIYEYDYDAMVLDLYKNNSWTRLPMELILMALSRVYEIQFKIYSNKSEYVHCISVWTPTDTNIDVVYLGHINEEHYVPVVKLNDDIVKNYELMDEYMKNYPVYTSAKKNYHNWAKNITSNYIYDTNTNSQLSYDLEQINNLDDFDFIK